MNYTEINQKYPKAFEAICQWCFMVEYQSPEELFYRDLYDFFDEKGIRVDIDVMEPFLSGPIMYYWNVNGIDPGIDHPTRTEAETAAFTKAFEILEKKLSEKL